MNLNTLTLHLEKVFAPSLLSRTVDAICTKGIVRLDLIGQTDRLENYAHNEDTANPRTFL